MEVDAIYDLIVNLWDKKRVGICCIVSDDDTTMRAHLKHSWSEKIKEKKMSKDEWPRTAKGRKKDDNGRLPLRIPEPTFLADPSHRKKSFGKHLFALATLPKRKSLVDKALAQKLQRGYAYMLHDVSLLDWKLNQEKILTMAMAPLEHSFNNHAFCSDKWCRSLQAKAIGTEYSPPIPYLSKSVNCDIYDQLKSVFDKFTAPEVIRESIHLLNTQKNEAFNNVAACLSPKKKYLAESVSLISRLLIAVSYVNDGFTNFYSKVFDWIGVDDINTHAGYIPRKFLARLDYQRENDAQRKSQPEYKRKRKFGDQAKVSEQILLERTKDKHMGTYKSAIAMTTNEDEDMKTNEDEDMKTTDGRNKNKRFKYKDENETISIGQVRRQLLIL